MSNLTTDFFENESHALRAPEIVLRDSLGLLAIEILKSRHSDFSKLKSGDMLRELLEIINELHDEYQHQAF